MKNEEEKTYLSNVESLPSIQRFEKEVKKVDEDIQKFKISSANATQVVVGGVSKKVVEPEFNNSKDFYINNEIKPPVRDRRNKKLILIALALSAVVLSGVVLVIVFVILPMFIKTNKNKTNASNVASSSTVSYSSSPTAEPTLPLFGSFSTFQNQIVDGYLNPVRLSGLSWYGFDGSTFTPPELSSQSYQSIIDNVKIQGFNSIRLPFSSEMLAQTTPAIDIDFHRNPDLVGLTPLQCLDRIVTYCGSVGLRVVLSRYSSKASNFANEVLWYIPGDSYFTDAQFLADWVMLSQRYLNTAVVGADLWDQPRALATWGPPLIVTDQIVDWRQAAETVGEAILNQNPQWLIFVQGLEAGTSLQSPATNPLRFSVPNKIVYSVHVSPLTTPTGENDADSLRAWWNLQFGFFLLANVEMPIYVVEFTADLGSSNWLIDWISYSNGDYLQANVSALAPNEMGISWSYHAQSNSSNSNTDALITADNKQDYAFSTALTVNPQLLSILRPAQGKLLKTFNPPATISPTYSPSSTKMPKISPTAQPSMTPSAKWSTSPTFSPRMGRTNFPTSQNPTVTPSAEPTTSSPSATPSTVAPSFTVTASPSASPTLPPIEYFHTSGNQIAGRQGEAIRITGISWTGFETAATIPQGLWVRSYKSLLNQIKSIGFNTVRISFCNQMFTTNAAITSGIDFSRNPDLVGLSALGCLDSIIFYAGSIGLRIILVRYSAMQDNFYNEASWFISGDPYYTEQLFISDWVMLAKRYLGWAVVGVDLWQQPRGQSTWGTGANTDWDAAATKVGNAILAVNPNLLILVQGINWGTDLTGAATSPIILSKKNQVVYSVVQFTNDPSPNPWFSAATFPNNLLPLWNQYYGFIVQKQIGPVLISEFGTNFKYPTDYVWLPLFLNYTDGHYTSAMASDLPSGHVGMSWCYFALNPGDSVGGVLGQDWTTPDSTRLSYLKPFFAPLFQNFDPHLPLPPVNPNITLMIPFPTITTTQAPTLPVFNYFHTSGNQIVDRMGNPLKITAINWLGFETSSFIAQGLWTRSYQSLLTQIQSLGFNAIRISFSEQMLLATSVTNGINTYANPDLAGLSPLQCLDKIIAFCGSLTLRVILARTSAKADNFNSETLWYISGDSYYSEAQFIADWVTLAKRYAGTAVIGADLWEQPRGSATWGTGASTDWDLAAARVGNAILAANPNWLIFVEGIVWGTDLRAVATKPVKLSVKNHVVYSVVQYSNDNAANTWFTDSTFPNNLRTLWNQYYGFIVQQQIAPLFVCEFGTNFNYQSDYTWLPMLLNYTVGHFTSATKNDLPPGHLGMSWAFEAINPTSAVGGIVANSDWTTVDYQKMYYLSPFLAPAFTPVDPGAPILTPNPNATEVYPFPTTTVTMAPTGPIVTYFYTSGNQIVDRSGNTAKFSGINWYGFDGTAFIPQGLWVRGYQSLLDQVKSLGFNVVRLPFSNQMLLDASATNGIYGGVNPDLIGLSPLQCLDKLIAYSSLIGLRVILVRASAKANNFYNENLWYITGDSYYTHQRFIEDWATLAKRYVGSGLIGVDLWEQPRGLATWATGNVTTDWDTAATLAGNAVLAVNPDLLVIVEGISWGSDLTGVMKKHVKLTPSNKLIYGVAQYTNDDGANALFTASDFPNNLRGNWNAAYGFIVTQQIAPVIVAEFGTNFQQKTDYTWLPLFMNYTAGQYAVQGKSDLPPGHKGLSWIWQGLNPNGPGGGLLASDWLSVNYAIMYYLEPFFAEQFTNPTPGQALPKADLNSSWVVAFPSLAPTTVAPTSQPTMSPTKPHFSYYHTSGNQIVDQNGKSIRWSGLNWYGFEGVGNIPQGLWARNWRDLINQVKSLGFNAFRIPYSNQMLRNDSVVTGVWWGENPDLVGLSPLQCLDLIVEYCGQVGMRIVLDRHSSLSNNFIEESYWYIPGDSYYTEERYIQDWVFLAKRYRNTAIIAADLWNEPKINATWGTGILSTDWRLAAERVGNAIQAVNPDWLLVVEGIGGATWWGGDLSLAGQYPVRFKIPNKLVYSVHEYCEDVSKQAWFSNTTVPPFPASLRKHWDSNFGYLVREKIAPVYIGEYGTRFAHPTDYIWLPLWVNYTNGQYTSDGVNDLLPGQTGLSWTFWALNPGGDTGGILEDDWTTADEFKLSFIRKAMAPMLPTLSTAIPGVGVNYSATYSPAVSPTASSSRYRKLHKTATDRF